MSQLIRFGKVVPEGKAMGHLPDGRAVFTIGPLPGELARVGIRKQHKTYAEAVLREIVEPSAKRKLTAEDHSLICSPWQGVAYDYQLELKQTMLEEAYAQQHLVPPFTGFIPAPARLAYRNRLDFSVIREDARLQLAFHVRGSWSEFTLLPDGCKLGSPAMNQAAARLVEQLNAIGFEVEPATITVREARSGGQLLTVLTTSASGEWHRIDGAALGNFLVTRPASRAGAPGEIVYQSGESSITDRLAGIDIT
ncbi:MAG TPA: hypothetical protein VMR98_04665, partial [Candidatus Polarisedimenticolaceae bacterium]|nr:hypothetical protein [Candidatus Polarisedimenticolaceae bacterium]